MSFPNTPPVLAGQSRSSDKEVAAAQETMASTFSREQEAAGNAREQVNKLIAAGEDLQLHVYKNHLPSCHYVFRDGSQATFVNGEFKTANPYEIEQLDSEIRRGHPHIYISKDAPAVVSAKLDADPMAALRAKIRAEIELENAPKDMGANRPMDGTQLKPANTSDVAAAVAGGAPTAASIASSSGTGQQIPAALKAALNKTVS